MLPKYISLQNNTLHYIYLIMFWRTHQRWSIFFFSSLQTRFFQVIHLLRHKIKQRKKKRGRFNYLEELLQRPGHSLSWLTLDLPCFMDGSDLLEELMSNIMSSELSPDDPLSYTSDCPNSCLRGKMKKEKKS